MIVYEFWASNYLRLKINNMKRFKGWIKEISNKVEVKALTNKTAFT